MTVDSYAHWLQAKSGVYNNWHPIAAALVMRGAQSLGAVSPAPVLFVQAFALALGAWRFTSSIAQWPSRRPWRVFLVVALLFFPPVLFYAQVMWKDVWMGIALLYAAAGFLTLSKDPQTRTGWVEFALGTIASAALRHNGLLVALVLTAALAFHAFRLRHWRVATAAAAVFMASAIVPGLLALAVGATDLKPVHQVLVHDIAASERCDNLAHFKSSKLADVFPEEALRDGYTSREVVPLFYDWAGKRKVIAHAVAAEHLNEIWALWRETVGAHPSCYLGHRWDVFAELAGLRREPVCYPFELRVGPNDFGINADSLLPGVKASLGAVGERLGNSFIFRGWVYAAATLGLFVLAVWRRQHVAWVYAAVLAYFAAYLPLATTCDFRLSWALVPVVLFGAIGTRWHREVTRPDDTRR